MAYLFNLDTYSIPKYSIWTCLYCSGFRHLSAYPSLQKHRNWCTAQSLENVSFWLVQTWKISKRFYRVLECNSSFVWNSLYIWKISCILCAFYLSSRVWLVPTFSNTFTFSIASILIKVTFLSSFAWNL